MDILFWLQKKKKKVKPKMKFLDIFSKSKKSEHILAQMFHSAQLEIVHFDSGIKQKQKRTRFTKPTGGRGRRRCHPSSNF